jgi:hypothetical protein
MVPDYFRISPAPKQLAAASCLDWVSRVSYREDNQTAYALPDCVGIVSTDGNAIQADVTLRAAAPDFCRMERVGYREDPQV